MRRGGHANKYVITWYCSVCDAEHTTEHDGIEIDYTGCDCCSDEMYVEAVCPELDEKVRVSVWG